MKKILVFYGSYGGGHLSAAKSISSYLTDNYKNDVETIANELNNLQSMRKL